MIVKQAVLGLSLLLIMAVACATNPGPPAAEPSPGAPAVVEQAAAVQLPIWLEYNRRLQELAAKEASRASGSPVAFFLSLETLATLSERSATTWDTRQTDWNEASDWNEATLRQNLAGFAKNALSAARGDMQLWQNEADFGKRKAAQADGYASLWQEQVADAEAMVAFWERNLPALEELVGP